MNIGKLLNVKKVIEGFADEKIPSKLSYKFMKFVSKIDTEERFYIKKMQEIVELYGAKDSEGRFIAEGNGIKIIEEKREECNKAIMELNSVEVDIPECTFTMDELEPLSLSIQDMMALADFIKE